jgi:hypothetical protein
MEQIYTNAISIIMKRIKSCGLALQKELDAYSIAYWQMELSKANYRKIRIEKRFKYNNVIKVDFVAKQRVA